jgi:hypothetical protein
VVAASTAAAVEGSSGASRFLAVSQQWLIGEQIMHITVKRFDAFQKLRLKIAVVTGAVLLVAGSAPLSFAQKSTQSFSSAEAASHALFVAVQSDNDQAVARILGGGTELVSTDDRAEDKLEREQFAKKYEEMHRLVREPDGSTVLYVGAENWPFPVPLVSRAGAWYFDAVAGEEEILFRRIGGNEETAIETCHALVISRPRQENAATVDDPITQYAQTLVRAHQMNAGSDAPASKEDPSGPFHGYYFRMLSGQPKSGAGAKAGFTFIAYPAEYRSSGVMTFVVTQNNVVYKRDFGADTAKLAMKVTAGGPFSSWHRAE